MLSDFLDEDIAVATTLWHNTQAYTVDTLFDSKQCSSNIKLVPVSVASYRGAENAGHAKAKQKTSSEAANV